MKKNRKLSYVFLPILVYYMIQQGASIFVSQILLAVIAFANRPITVTQLMGKVIDYISSENFVLILSVSSAAIGIIVYTVWYRRILKQEDASNTKQRLYLSERKRALVFPGIVFTAVGCQFVGSFLVDFLVKAVPQLLIMYKKVLESMGLPVSGGEYRELSVMLIIYTVLVAPVVEELIVRGVSLRYGLRATSPLLANVMCALLFAIMHGNMLQGIYAFLFALILGFIYIQTRRIFIVIMIHVIFNGISIFFANYMYLGNNFFEAFIILFTSMVAIYVGILMIVRAYGTAEDN